MSIKPFGSAGPVKHQPCVMQVLVYLAAHPGKVVTKEELVRDVGEGAFVNDEALTYTISELSKRLGDDAREPRLFPLEAKHWHSAASGANRAPPMPAAIVRWKGVRFMSKIRTS